MSALWYGDFADPDEEDIYDTVERLEIEIAALRHLVFRLSARLQKIEEEFLTP